MQYALDENGSWVNAKSTTYKKHNQYFCGCLGRHSVKLVKPSGSLGKRPFSDYFAHITKPSSESDHHTSTGYVSNCMSGESLDHFNAKHNLRDMVGKYSFTTFRCIKCHDTRDIHTDGCEVIVEHASKDKKWRYDCLLLRNGIDIAALEVLHSHKVTNEKKTAVLKSGLEIAEFRAEDVLELLAERPTDTVHLQNLLVQLGTCQQCLVRGGLMWLRDCYVEELKELIQQETDVVADYINIDARIRKKLIRKKQTSEKFLGHFKRI
jgi:hypothetical protein